MKFTTLKTVKVIFATLILFLGNAPLAAHSAQLLLEADFTTDHQDFTYIDDIFKNTSQPIYAYGNYDSAGGFSGGGLHIALGGVDPDDILNGMSGGWSKEFTVPQDANITITLRYRLVHYGDFEPDECSQVLIAVDDQPIQTQGNDYLAQFCGLGDGNPTQDTTWSQVTKTISLNAGSHKLTMGGYLSQKTYNNEISDIYFDDIKILASSDSGENCSNGIDDDGDDLVDCLDSDCAADTACSSSPPLLSEKFDTADHGFDYSDDSFRATANPIYASGDYSSTDGYTTGAVHIALGGMDDDDILDGMSGGWSKSFTMPAAGNVTITLRYRLIHFGDFEPDECSQVLVAVDDSILNDNGSDHLAEYCGHGDGNPTQDTQWQQAQRTVFLGAGTHTLTLGGYLNQKTYSNEITDLYFDDINITSDITSDFEIHCSNGSDDDGDGQIDCMDLDCASDPACQATEETQCSNGVDDDGDGLVDCADNDCAFDPACQTTTETQCSDGVDNDDDGQTDCSDIDCTLDPACQQATETNCTDGVDDDGDELIDCADNDCASDPTCQALRETDCANGSDDDGDGQIDCADSDCAADAACSQTTLSSTLLLEEFDGPIHGFSYIDDPFYGTNNAYYSSGNYSDTEGYDGGGVHISLGGRDDEDILNGMSGGWTQDFRVPKAGNITISFNYRLVHFGDFDSGECSQAIVAVDDTIVGHQDADYVSEYCGMGDGSPTQDTGWRQFELTIFLNAGTHTLTLGGYLTQKTYNNEAADIYFDNIDITSDFLSYSVKLAWEPLEVEIDGYRIYMRTEGQNYDYDSPVWQGATTSCSIYGLEAATTYYFVARAFLGNLESEDSNEVSFTTAD